MSKDDIVILFASHSGEPLEIYRDIVGHKLRQQIPFQIEGSHRMLDASVQEGDHLKRDIHFYGKT